jgi:NAD(P)-dependent dehydrogenase (short-subunit alcohol dehydrogenase family)
MTEAQNVALVTGASTGLGLETCRQLAALRGRA